MIIQHIYLLYIKVYIYTYHTYIYIYVYRERERESSGMIRMVSTCHCHGKVAISYTRPDGQTFHAWLLLVKTFWNWVVPSAVLCGRVSSCLWTHPKRARASMPSKMLTSAICAVRTPVCWHDWPVPFQKNFNPFHTKCLDLFGHCPHFTWISRSTSQVEEVWEVHGFSRGFHMGFTWNSSRWASRGPLWFHVATGEEPNESMMSQWWVNEQSNDPMTQWPNDQAIASSVEGYSSSSMHRTWRWCSRGTQNLGGCAFGTGQLGRKTTANSKNIYEG